MPEILVFYRGPLERSRLNLIITAAKKQCDTVSFYWLYPGKQTEFWKNHGMNFLRTFGLKEIFYECNSWKYFFKSNFNIFNITRKNNYDHLYIVGFSAPIFSFFSKKSIRVWFVNGIPEEKISADNYLNKFLIKFIWKIQGVASRANLIVTVSKRMSAYVINRVSAKNVIHIPTCTDLNTFNFDSNKHRKYFTYLGSGASWQSIDMLSLLWQKLHELDPSIKFRVISRDERCKILGENIAPQNIEFLESNSFEIIANYLKEAEVGFLLRRDNIVNNVCFPTKLGEYIASGAWVVSTNIDWDVKDYFNNHQIGLLINLKDSYSCMAKNILKYREQIKCGDIKLSLTECSNLLDVKFQLNKLIVAINNISTDKFTS